MRYSLIVPVYNRPDELKELLQSLAEQNYRDYEIIVVEDGSSLPCEEVVASFASGPSALPISYYAKENTGPGLSRNYGANKASGEYLIFLDSDVTIPDSWFEAIDAELDSSPCDAFGGPDRAADNFTPIQKAISYSMTSFFTTGGIRGGKKKMDKFYPRSFNMGIKKAVFEALGGYSSMRFGEDIDLSTRIFENSYSCRLFPQAWVYHKRRTDFRKFFRQVHNSGIARINLEKRHPGTLKAVHMLPAIFTIGAVFLLLLSFLSCKALIPLILYALLIFVDATLRNSCSIRIGLLSIIASYVQLIGYGSGFIRSFWKRIVLKQGEFEAYKKNFYK